MTRKVYLFMMISIDGYFEGLNHDLSWHNIDNEFHDFSNEQLAQTGAILFGHRTYDLMYSFWTSPETVSCDPITAKLMNDTPKFVASSKYFQTDWSNTSVVVGDFADTVRTLQKQPGKDIAIFGSNDLCVSLMQHQLVDEFRLMVNPVALGEGRSLFEGLDTMSKLRLIKTRQFNAGNILNIYSL